MKQKIIITTACFLIMSFNYAGIEHLPIRKKIVSVKGEDFYINNEVTLKNKRFNNMRLEGLLPNSRMALVLLMTIIL